MTVKEVTKNVGGSLTFLSLFLFLTVPHKLVLVMFYKHHYKQISKNYNVVIINTKKLMDYQIQYTTIC